MSTYNWLSFLTQWSKEMLSSLYARELPQDLKSSGWLGYPGATEEQITSEEARLGIALPPSYRTFLIVSNGFQLTGCMVPKLNSVEEIEWLRIKDPETVRIWTQGTTTTGPIEPIPDEEYFVYGEDQDPCILRPEYLETALQISEREIAGSAVYLLNPQIVTGDGEWEAWLFAHWLPGAVRYPSFWELMQGEFQTFLASKAHEEKRVQPGDNLDVLATKLPGLIEEYDQKIQQWENILKHNSEKAIPMSLFYHQGIIEGLRFARERALEIENSTQGPKEIHHQLTAFAEELERLWQETFHAMKTSSALHLLLTGDMNKSLQTARNAEGYREALGILRWFLNQI